jgi:hypothetical protein
MKALIFGILVFSCGAHDASLTSNTLSFLSPQAKEKLRTNGEVYFRIEIKTPDDTVRGTYRVVKINQTDKYRIVRIGPWYRNTYYSSNGRVLGAQRDFIEYDSLGNQLNKTIFDKPKGSNSFYVVNKLTSSSQNGLFLQHTIIYRQDSTMAAEFTMRVVNFSEVMNDDLKKKVKYGTQKDYDVRGKLVSETKYDENGKKVSVVKN